MTEDSRTIRKDVQLSFHADISGEPLVCHLVREYGLTFNILKAQITPRKEGHLTLELMGEPHQLREGIAYLRSRGVKVTGMAHEVRRNEDLCMHCGMCTALCPTTALQVEGVSRLVHFASENCTACGLCVRVCPVNAMLMDVRKDAL